MDNKLLCNVSLFKFFIVEYYYMSCYERCVRAVVELYSHQTIRVVSRLYRGRTKTCQRTNQETLRNWSN